MKKIVFIFAISAAYFFISFTTNKDVKNIQLYTTFNSLNISTRLDSLIRSYIADNGNNAIYHMFIDKIEYKKYRIFLCSGFTEFQYKRNNNPLFYLLVNGNKIFIYTGLEDFFEIDQSCVEFEKPGDYYKRWTIELEKDSIFVDSTGSCPAFNPYVQYDTRVKEQYKP